MIHLPFDIELMNGRGEPKTFHIRRAVPEDIDAVMALQQTIVDALPNKDVYATYTYEESLDALETDYCYMATADDGKVAGYSVLIANTTPVVEKNYGHYFDYDEEHLARTASLDLTMVPPEYRGYGLQRLFNKIRIGQAIELITSGMWRELHSVTKPKYSALIISVLSRARFKEFPFPADRTDRSIH